MTDTEHPPEDLSIRGLEFTPHTQRCLDRGTITTITELTGSTPADLLDIRRFGLESLDEVRAKLAALGLALREAPDRRPPKPRPPRGEAPLARRLREARRDGWDEGFAASGTLRPDHIRNPYTKEAQ